MNKFGIVLVSVVSLVGCAGQEDVQDVQPQVESHAQALGCASGGDGKTTLRFINHCAVPVHFAGNGGMSGGVIAPDGAECRNVGGSQEHMIGRRYWGWREGQDPGAGRYTLAEFGFNDDFAGYHSWDWFDISQVDAQNIPMKIVPYGEKCEGQTRACVPDLRADCPEGGKYREGGQVISCVNGQRDNPNGPVSSYFNNRCKEAYAWSGDDSGPMAACNADDFDIIFCPDSN